MLGDIAACLLTFLLVWCIRNWVFESALINLLTGNSVLLARIVVCLVLYLALFFLLKALFASLGFLEKIPVIRSINKILGFVAGGVYGILIVGILYIFYTWIS